MKAHISISLSVLPEGESQSQKTYALNFNNLDLKDTPSAFLDKFAKLIEEKTE